jgi:hypothetical protein
VLCASNDTWRVGRDAPANHSPAHCGGSFAYVGNFPIDFLKIDSGFLRLRKHDASTARQWSHGEQPLTDSTEPQRVAPARAHVSWRT